MYLNPKSNISQSLTCKKILDGIEDENKRSATERSLGQIESNLDSAAQNAFNSLKSLGVELSDADMKSILRDAFSNLARL